MSGHVCVRCGRVGTRDFTPVPGGWECVYRHSCLLRAARRRLQEEA